MTKVQAVENAIKQLTPDELRQGRAWLNDFLEDQLEFTDEFSAKIERSRQAMLARERTPGAPTLGNDYRCLDVAATATVSFDCL